MFRFLGSFDFTLLRFRRLLDLGREVIRADWKKSRSKDVNKGRRKWREEGGKGKGIKDHTKKL